MTLKTYPAMTLDGHDVLVCEDGTVAVLADYYPADTWDEGDCSVFHVTYPTGDRVDVSICCYRDEVGGRCFNLKVMLRGYVIDSLSKTPDSDWRPESGDPLSPSETHLIQILCPLA